jgi:hypothetical protein
MQLFLFILIATALVYALIRYLHAGQLRNARAIADQSTPLPPLEDTEITNPPITASTLSVAPEITPGGATASWRDEVKALRDAGRFQEALTLCSRQYPKILAFRQTMITLRSQLKAEDEQPDAQLQEIYRTAILAGLARAARQQADHNTDLIAQLPDLDEPKSYWNQYGYAHLDLLSRTDRNVLIKHWGEPANHQQITSLLPPADA